MKESPVKLTSFSHGAGCGCKIAPAVLDSILAAAGQVQDTYPDLLVGNEQRDDAAVMDLGDGTAIISTTDFFMPIVDDPKTFGRIAATNAISDVYAMGGKPLMAIAILGWPINDLAPEIAGEVVMGARIACADAGIPLAGGHSIDSPEPIFGLAVTGRVSLENIKKNGGASAGDILFITKPLGVGILSTAQKQGKLKNEHESLATEVMIRLNSAGERLAKIKGVTAMTDVTGFGLAGHLMEMCHASQTSAELDFDRIPVIDPCVLAYIHEGCVPGGTNRNFASYGHGLSVDEGLKRSIVCDPQTSGGLLVAVSPDSQDEVRLVLQELGLQADPIGKMVKPADKTVYIR